VLVVEDDEAIRGLLVCALRHEPLTVDAAADGREAARLAGENGYSLMLVDLMLPHMTGLEFLSRFREEQPSAATVVLLMTASDDEIVRGSASNLVHGFIRKPFDIVNLVQVVTDIAMQADAGAPPIRELKPEPWLAC
jgi:DNA-binding response OmpR family regulator